MTREIKDRKHRQGSYNMSMIPVPRKENRKVIIEYNTSNLIKFPRNNDKPRVSQHNCKMPGSYL